MPHETEPAAAHKNDALPASDPCHSAGAHDFSLVLDRTLDATPEKIWKAWMTPELLMQWFCPRPWRTIEAVIEPEVGGRFYTVMQGPDGMKMPNEGVFLEAVPNRRWTTTDAFVKGWLPAGAPFMAATVELTPLADGKTRYVATARHWSEASMKQHEQMGFHEGWGAAADQLADLLKTL